MSPVLAPMSLPGMVPLVVGGSWAQEVGLGVWALTHTLWLQAGTHAVAELQFSVPPPDEWVFLCSGFSSPGSPPYLVPAGTLLPLPRALLVTEAVEVSQNVLCTATYHISFS